MLLIDVGQFDGLALREGTCIDGLQAGSIYLLRVKGAAVKVMVR